MAIEIWSLTLRDTDFGPVGAKISIPQGEGPRYSHRRIAAPQLKCRIAAVCVNPRLEVSLNNGHNAQFVVSI